MTGTIVNVIAIVAGSLVGMLFKRGIPERINTAVIKVVGIAIIVVGLNGVLTSMLTVGAGGKLEADGTVILLISLVIGCIIGELLKIEDRINKASLAIERKLKADNFAKGFVTASLIYVIGAMSIVGAINDGLMGDSTLLFTKAMLDGITSIILASTFGVGVLFAAVPVFIYQGAISMLARFIAPYATDEPIRLISMVGYALVMTIGFNFLVDTKIRVANLLPALAVPIIYYVVFVNFF